MSDNKILINALKSLELNQHASIEEARQRYFERTGQARFKIVFLNDDSAKSDFLKYHEAFVIAMREYKVEHPQTDMDYYPPQQVFNLLFNQGVYYLIKENLIKAGQKFEEAERLKGKHALTKIYLGIILMKRKNYYAAEKYFKKAVEFENDNSDAWYYMGYNYMRAGQYQKAEAAFLKAKDLNPFRKDILDSRRKLQNLSGKKKGGNKISFLNKLFRKQ